MRCIFLAITAFVFSVWNVAGYCVVATPAFAQTKDAGCEGMDDIDPNNHGTIDLAAAKKAGTELIRENNPEFLKVVEDRFNAADADHDGSIDCNELGTSDGRSLLTVTTRGGIVRSVRQLKMPSSR
jgi:hypothetical protein